MAVAPARAGQAAWPCRRRRGAQGSRCCLPTNPAHPSTPRTHLPEDDAVRVDVALFVVGLRAQHLCSAGRVRGGCGAGVGGCEPGTWQGPLAGRGCTPDGGVQLPPPAAGPAAPAARTGRGPLGRAGLALGGQHSGAAGAGQAKVAHLLGWPARGARNRSVRWGGVGCGAQVRAGSGAVPPPALGSGVVARPPRLGKKTRTASVCTAHLDRHVLVHQQVGALQVPVDDGRLAGVQKVLRGGRRVARASVSRTGALVSSAGTHPHAAHSPCQRAPGPRPEQPAQPGRHLSPKRTMPRAMSSAICRRRRSSGLKAGVRCSSLNRLPRGTNCVTMHRCGGCVTAPRLQGWEPVGGGRQLGGGRAGQGLGAMRTGAKTRLQRAAACQPALSRWPAVRSQQCCHRSRRAHSQLHDVRVAQALHDGDFLAELRQGPGRGGAHASAAVYL